MSDIIPDIEEADHFPYCIWYPDVAKEETYRQLATKYPNMKYSVGRACAVAGYVDLWRELDLLPDVSIAEEARDNIWMSAGSKVIFEDIMIQGVLYNVMNDYTLSISEKPSTGRLNCDTCVRSELRKVHSYTRNKFERTEHDLVDYQLQDRGKMEYNPAWPSEVEVYWNITEDWCISDHQYEEEKEKVSNRRLALPIRSAEPRYRPEPEVDERIALLYSPLPIDLPNINKMC
jgi:hypothetical protein